MLPKKKCVWLTIPANFRWSVLAHASIAKASSELILSRTLSSASHEDLGGLAWLGAFLADFNNPMNSWNSPSSASFIRCLRKSSSTYPKIKTSTQDYQRIEGLQAKLCQSTEESKVAKSISLCINHISPSLFVASLNEKKRVHKKYLFSTPGAIDWSRTFGLQDRKVNLVFW